jgi:Flp pilus assembly secretin CpaC
MAALAALRGRWPQGRLVSFALAFVLLAVSGSNSVRADGNPPAEPSAAADPIVVHLDQAKILKLPERTVTLVVGNPLIADVAVQPGGILVVTGKSHGVTNLVALDRGGDILMQHALQVQGPRDYIVVVHRGVDRESYSCTPNCERRITLGDTPNYFGAILNQTGNLNTMAQGAQAK